MRRIRKKKKKESSTSRENKYTLIIYIVLTDFFLNYHNSKYIVLSSISNAQEQSVKKTSTESQSDNIYSQFVFFQLDPILKTLRYY